MNSVKVKIKGLDVVYPAFRKYYIDNAFYYLIAVKGHFCLVRADLVEVVGEDTLGASEL